MQRVTKALFPILFFFLAIPPCVGLADLFELKEGGNIEGTYLNPQEIPRKTYKIKTSCEMEIDIEPKYVESVRKGEREAVTEYNEFAPFKEDTVQNHLEIAAWCRDKQLRDLSDLHLNRVVELDPENKQARHLLDQFKRDDGSWTTRDDHRASKGLINNKGSWQTSQQIKIDQFVEKRERLAKHWNKWAKSIQGVLPRDAKARQELLEVTDPHAASAIFKALATEPDPDNRKLYLRALANIATPAAVQKIAEWSVGPEEPIDDVRLDCFDLLRKNEGAVPAMTAFYCAVLRQRTDSPAMINLAARGLAELNARSAIPNLIESLNTSYIETKKVTANQYSSGGGLTQGNKTVSVVKPSQNIEVLRALRSMTGVDFQYNEAMWRAWLIQTRRPADFDVRRDYL